MYITLRVSRLLNTIILLVFRVYDFLRNRNRFCYIIFLLQLYALSSTICILRVLNLLYSLDYWSGLIDPHDLS